MKSSSCSALPLNCIFADSYSDQIIITPLFYMKFKHVATLHIRLSRHHWLNCLSFCMFTNTFNIIDNIVCKLPEYRIVQGIFLWRHWGHKKSKLAQQMWFKTIKGNTDFMVNESWGSMQRKWWFWPISLNHSDTAICLCKNEWTCTTPIDCSDSCCSTEETHFSLPQRLKFAPKTITTNVTLQRKLHHPYNDL